MSLNRYAKRRDATERPIIKDLRRCGYQVRQQDFPDLAVRRMNWPDGVVQLLEVDGITRNRKRSDNQLEFLRLWHIPIVKNLEGALAALESLDLRQSQSAQCLFKPGMSTQPVAVR